MLFSSMKNKMTFAVFLLIILIMSTTAVFALMFFEQKFKESLSSDQFALLSAIAGQMDERIFDALVDLDAVAESFTPAMIAEPSRAQALLDTTKKHQVFFDNTLFLFSRSGRLIAASPREINFIGRDYSFRDYFKETLRTGKICISPPFESIQQKRQPIIMFTTPVYDPAGKIIAVLGGGVNLKQQRYLRSLAAMKLGQNGFLSLYDADRTVLMHQDPAQVLQKVPKGTIIDSGLQGYQRTGESVTMDGVPVLRSVTQLRSTGWILAISYPLEEAYAPLYTARSYFLVGTLLAAFFSIPLVWLFMKNLTSPLMQLTAHIEQLPTLTVEQRLIPTGTESEIGILSGAFNRMLMELDRQQAALVEQKEFAESLVLNSSLPTFVIDSQHKLLFWNKACEELTGVKAAEITGTDRYGEAFCSGTIASVADRIIERNAEALSATEPVCRPSTLVTNGWHYEGWHECRSGMQRYIVVDAAPICNHKGEVVAAIETLQDVTEQKRIEQELEKSRDFYLTLFENFPSLIWRTDTEGKCNFTNRNWLEFTGHTLTEEIGDGWAAGIHPEDRDRCLSSFFAAMHTRGEYEIVYRHRRHDGVYRWLHDMGRPFNDLSGTFGGYIGYSRDITDQEEAAAKIRQLSSVIEQSPNSVVITDLKGTIEYANNRTLAETGYQTEDLLGASVALLHPSHSFGMIEEAMNWVASTGEVWRDEVQGRVKDGEIVWEQLFISPIANREGRITHLVGIKENVTQRKQAEQELLESEERHRQMFEHNPHPMWAMDVETLEFLAVNNAAVQRYGYSREEFLSMRATDIRHAEDVPGLLADIARVEKGFDSAGVWRHVRKDGSELLAEISSHSMIFSGRRAKIVLAHDVTDRVRAEEEKKVLERQLRQSQKLEAIGTLAGGIAHDFNNILTVIMACATILQKKTEEESACRRQADRIVSAAEKAAKLTQSLLAYSRKQISNPWTVNLNQVVEGATPLLRRLLPESAEFTACYAQQELVVMADPGQIEQMLMNLVANARDALPLSGEVSITTELARFDEPLIAAQGYGRPGMYACITVADTGTGMDESVRERMFDPFFTTKEVGKGTGLGLAMVYGIVKQHRGYINCSSEPGRGTVFSIYFPLVPSAGKTPEPKTVTAAAGGSETILVVEDDEEVRELIRDLLQEAGYTVVVAVNGQDGVDRFTAHKDEIGLVILDVIMPKMNGAEVYRNIQHISVEPKVLFISGYTAETMTGNFMMNDGCDILTKPIRPNDLLSKVREILETD